MMSGDEGSGVVEGRGLEDLNLQLAIDRLANIGWYRNRQSSGFEIAQKSIGLLSSSKGIGLKEVQCIVPATREEVSVKQFRWGR